MKTRVLVGVGVSSVVLLASCMQDRGATPLLPTQASYAKPSVGSCVAWSTTNGNARLYFASSKDPVLTLLDSMQAYFSAGDGTNTNRMGYKVLARLEYAVNAPASANLVAGSPAQGSTFANNVLGCMTIDGYAARSAAGRTSASSTRIRKR